MDLEYSAGSSVNKVVCVLFVLRIRLFSVEQLVIEYRYGFMIIFQFYSMCEWL